MRPSRERIRGIEMYHSTSPMFLNQANCFNSQWPSMIWSHIVLVFLIDKKLLACSHYQYVGSYLKAQLVAHFSFLGINIAYLYGCL